MFDTIENRNINADHGEREPRKFLMTFQKEKSLRLQQLTSEKGWDILQGTGNKS